MSSLEQRLILNKRQNLHRSWPILIDADAVAGLLGDNFDGGDTAEANYLFGYVPVAKCFKIILKCFLCCCFKVGIVIVATAPYAAHMRFSLGADHVFKCQIHLKITPMP